MNKLKSIVPVVAAMLAACRLYPKAEELIPPSTVSAISGVNTEFDDFNAAAPRWLGDNIVFSSNRGTMGGTLDIYFASVRIYKSHPADTPQLSDAKQPPTQVLTEVSTSDNERGPIIYSDRASEKSEWYFSSDRPGGKGGFDLYTGKIGFEQKGWPPRVENAVAVSLNELNSAKDDYYLTLPFAGNLALFASNRDGDNFDIFQASWDNMTAFPNGQVKISKVNELASAGDDTAPYVDGTDLVFASNRGGTNYDLFCSTYTNGQWLAPKRLDDTINSLQDEFRPSLIGRGSERVLMFSSNRPRFERALVRSVMGLAAEADMICM
jgi:hypothetical protein